MAISSNVKIKTMQFINKYIDEETSAPINIKEIIKSEGINLKSYLFDNDISGILILENESKTIGYDMSEYPVRQRFTQAHELGHYVLHAHKSNLFMDKVLFKRQSDGYSSAEAIIEQEANYFAANILMPEILVKREVLNMECDLHDDENIEKLAQIFNVSQSAMTFRLINLGII